MKVNLGKGTEMFDFFGKFYKHLSDYYTPENKEEYWGEMLDSTNKLLSEYKQCEFYDLANGIMWVLWNWQERRFKGEKISWWKIKIDTEDEEVVKKL